MPQLNHAADSPPRALAPCLQHRNSRVCRSDAKRMETVWRSSMVRALRMPSASRPQVTADTAEPPDQQGRVWAAAAGVSALLTAAIRQEMSGASRLTSDIDGEPP